MKLVEGELLWLTFCLGYLRLRGIDGKQHPVFTELTRLKHYIGKIEEAEKPPERRAMTLDKAAAGRFIKHGLVSPLLVTPTGANTDSILKAGNDKFDLERKEQSAKEKARAQFKASVLANKAKKSEQSSKQPSDADASLDSDNDASDDEEMVDGGSAPTAEPEEAAGDDKSNNRKQRKKLQKEERQKTKADRRQKKQEARKAKQAK